MGLCEHLNTPVKIEYLDGQDFEGQLGSITLPDTGAEAMVTLLYRRVWCLAWFYGPHVKGDNTTGVSLYTIPLSDLQHPLFPFAAALAPPYLSSQPPFFSCCLWIDVLGLATTTCSTP